MKIKQMTIAKFVTWYPLKIIAINVMIIKGYRDVTTKITTTAQTNDVQTQKKTQNCSSIVITIIAITNEEHDVSFNTTAHKQTMIANRVTPDSLKIITINVMILKEKRCY